MKLIQNQGFILKNFEIPAFALSKGEMIRFWIEFVPQSKTDTDGYWVPSKIIEAIQSNQRSGEKAKMAPLRVKRSFSDYIQPKTLRNHLRDKYGLDTVSIIEKLSFFELNPYWKVKNLGSGHQKVFAVICEFQEKNIVYFDYIGLAPDSEEQLTAYVKTELQKNKSAISFDNLYYKPENPDSERICNIIVKQKRKTNENNV
ncbi:hypothetical protein [Rufibacter hautae]|uniref:Uncharacterized protein n=1 Tax=Rufibacter hautae TaxID=2595005 RepID=A0A5B6TFC4_9BACT|nr:hypothetical protein [Rufibacter hautae]KAA3437922.1 hypothetical protein FOA19_11605 [Rufibacter hautae]